MRFHLPNRAAKILVFLIALSFWGCSATQPPAPVEAGTGNSIKIGRILASRNGIVVCVEENAARIGAQVLADGGNAVDAAVATAFALAVTHPQAGNIAGGGFMIIRSPDGEVDAVDYRETAPLAFHPEIFLTPDGKIDKNKVENPHLLVGVPGTVAGLALAHGRHGKRPFHLLLMPAIRLAMEGFIVPPLLAHDLRQNARKLSRHSATSRVFFHWNGNPLAAGERLKQPELGSILRAIASEGPDIFYQDWIADTIARTVRKGGGLLTADDFKTYEAKLRKPIKFPLAGGTLIGMPPPSSGGIAVAQILGILEDLPVRKFDPLGPRAAHVLAEAMRRVFRDRAMYLGDPDFVDVPVERLLSLAHLKKLRDSIDMKKATPSEKLWFEPLAENEGGETTHISVIDRDGMAVSNTYTLERSFGGGVMVSGTGILLNNELGDFNFRPGHTDRKGLIGTLPNIPMACKRPLSSMSPTLYVRDNKVEIITGSPGGRTIINTVACILFNRVFQEQSPAHCVWGPRLHHKWFPDRITLEKSAWPDATAKALARMGHTIHEQPAQGSAHSIFLDPVRGYVGVGDFRRDGWAAGPVQ